MVVIVINMNKFSEKSLHHYRTCHPLLQVVLKEALQVMDFSIIQGNRGKEAQNKAFEDGFSGVKFPDSKHNKLPSEAFDIIPYPFKGWENKEQFYELAGVIKTIAYQHNIRIRWGGEFKSRFDGAHFELED